MAIDVRCDRGRTFGFKNGFAGRDAAASPLSGLATLVEMPLSVVAGFVTIVVLSPKRHVPSWGSPASTRSDGPGMTRG